MTENKSKYGKVVIVGGGRNAGRTLKQHIDLLEEIQAYRAIGTVEECRVAVERMKPKKAITQSMISYCPTCKERLYSVAFNVGYCRCGQKLNW